MLYQRTLDIKPFHIAPANDGESPIQKSTLEAGVLLSAEYDLVSEEEISRYYHLTYHELEQILKSINDKFK